MKILVALKFCFSPQNITFKFQAFISKNGREDSFEITKMSIFGKTRLKFAHILTVITRIFGFQISLTSAR